MIYYGIVLYERLLNGARTMYDEVGLVVEAGSKEEAHAEVLRLARQQEHEYESANGKTVSVVFKELVEVEEVLCDEVNHGCTIFARTFEDLDAYKTFIDSVLWR